METVATPIDVTQLGAMMSLSGYDQAKSDYLIEGFTNGFELGFYGPRDVVREAPNMKFHAGDEIDLWNKIMKEVQEGHTLGPYRGQQELPFNHYWQNPVGLIPKKGNPNESRMIVNLSYKDQDSVNYYTKKEECTVQYNDIDAAIEMIMGIKRHHGEVYLGKCDGRAAFRQLPVVRKDFPLLVMKAKDPVTKQWCYFVDKVIVFGSSRSCRIFSEFAAALAHIAQYYDLHNTKPNEYLDDVLTGGHTVTACNNSLANYLWVCQQVRFPIADEKTVWATQLIEFLGLLLNVLTMTLSVPVDKRNNALNQIEDILRRVKITMLRLQKLTGLLNFLCRAVVPGRAFTRRFYDRMTGLKQYHHLRVDPELWQDLLVWKEFLKLPSSLCRPFMDFHTTLQADTLDFYTDASKSTTQAGFGIVYGDQWTFGEFPVWVRTNDVVAIQTLEMYALYVAIRLFAHTLKGRRVKVFCDNQAVCGMINKGTSRCKTCMQFLRSITLISMKHQVRFFAKFVPSLENTRADALSRMEFNRFFKASPGLRCTTPIQLPIDVWPLRPEWWGLSSSVWE